MGGGDGTSACSQDCCESQDMEIVRQLDHLDLFMSHGPLGLHGVLECLGHLGSFGLFKTLDYLELII